MTRSPSLMREAWGHGARAQRRALLPRERGRGVLRHRTRLNREMRANVWHTAWPRRSKVCALLPAQTRHREVAGPGGPCASCLDRTRPTILTFCRKDGAGCCLGQEQNVWDVVCAPAPESGLHPLQWDETFLQAANTSSGALLSLRT